MQDRPARPVLVVERGDALAAALRTAGLAVFTDAQHASGLALVDLTGPPPHPRPGVDQLLREGRFTTVLGIVDTETPASLRLMLDDYLIAPFSPAQLTTRVRFHLDARPRATARLALSSCGVELSTGGVDNGKRLTGMELALLRYLARHTGRSVSRDELERHVWDLKSGLQTNRVYVGIRRLREKIEADPKRPRHVLTVRGVGYRFEPADEDGRQRHPVHVPAPARATVGRRGELRALDALLLGGGIAVLTGPPGAGRTQLARTWAHERWDRALGPAVYVELGQVRSEAELRRALAGPLGCDADLDALVGRMGAWPAVAWILDDADRQDTGVEALVGQLHSLRPRAVFVLCSARRLALPGRVEVGPLEPADAEALFVARGREVRPDLSWTGPDPDRARLLAALDFLPLAIELAAARLAVFSVAELADSAAPATPDALDHALGGALEAMPPIERAAVLQLAVFAGSFDLPCAEAIVAPPADLPALLQSLVSRSLVQTRGDRGRTRFALFAPIRDRLRARLGRDRELADAVARRHEQHILALCDAMFQQLAGHSALGDRVAAAREDLLGVLQAVGQRDLAAAARLVLTLTRMRDLYRPDSAVRPLLDAAIAGEEALPEVEAVRLRLARAKADAYVGLPGVRRDLEAAAGRARTPAARLEVHRTQALVHRIHGRFEAAVASYRALEGLAVELEDEAHRTDAWQGLGTVCHRRGKLGEASRWLERALEAVRASGDRWREAAVLDSLAVVRRDQGRIGEAVQLLHAALNGVRRTAGSRREDSGEAIVLAHLGTAERDRGHLGEGEARLEEALALLSDPWNRTWYARVRTALAWCDLLRGRPGPALRRLDARDPSDAASTAARVVAFAHLRRPEEAEALLAAAPIDSEDPRDGDLLALARWQLQPHETPPAALAGSASSLVRYAAQALRDQKPPSET